MHKLGWPAAEGSAGALASGAVHGLARGPLCSTRRSALKWRGPGLGEHAVGDWALETAARCAECGVEVERAKSDLCEPKWASKSANSGVNSYGPIS